MSEVKMSDVIMSEGKMSEVKMSDWGKNVRGKLPEVINMSEVKIAEVFVSGVF